MYVPVEQSPSSGMLDQGSQKEKGCCYKTACWIFQVLSWASLGVSVFFLCTKKGSPAIFASFGVFYIVYIILEFCSVTAKYLCNKSSNQGMYEKMGVHFMTPPLINFHCECYHYETVTTTTTDSEGNTHTSTTTTRVTTYRETYSMPYYSSRDVSGLFLLNCDKAIAQSKYYIKLELVEEINFADAISVYDYEREKAAFWRRNRFRDAHFDFRESRTIPRMKHHNLVRLHNKESCMVNFFWFFLFILLTFGEFYKLYFDSCCIFQRFKVRKLVSTRYDLNQPVYQVLVPQIDLISQQYQYDQQYYNYKNDNYDVQLPTEEELAAASQYQNRVPDYQISSGGDFQQGVIIDKPGYDYNPNEAPAEFAAVSGNVAIGQDQISAQGAPPPNFDQPGFRFSINHNEQTPNTNQGNPGGEIGYEPPKV